MTDEKITESNAAALVKDTASSTASDLRETANDTANELRKTAIDVADRLLTTAEGIAMTVKELSPLTSLIAEQQGAGIKKLWIVVCVMVALFVLWMIGFSAVAYYVWSTN